MEEEKKKEQSRTSTGQKRTSGMISRRRSSTQILQYHTHIRLRNAEFAVAHEQIRHLLDDRVVSVVLVRIAGQGESGKREFVAERRAGAGAGACGGFTDLTA